MSNTIINDYKKNTTEPELEVPNTIVEDTSNIAKNKYPGLMVELPSKGLLYPENHPLHSGLLEMKYMTAKEEDILTTESYIKTGVVLDKLFQSMILTKFNYDDLLIGDKEAVMVAARKYGYGETYDATITSPSGKKQKITVDLEKLENKIFEETLIVSKGVNKFSHTTKSGTVLEFKLLTVGDQKKVDAKIKTAKSAGRSATVTATLSEMILSINGETDRGFIERWVLNDLRAIDSKNLRDYIKSITPGVNLTIECTDEDTFEPFQGTINFGLDLFWPELGV